MLQKTLKNKKQELFCQQYIVDYNGTQAAIRAGYSARSAKQNAARMLTNDDVLARVRELQHEQLERMALTQDLVVTELLATYKRCSEAVPVMVRGDDGEMTESGTYQFDSRGALRALELLGKHMGMFGDKLALSAKVDTGQLGAVLAQLGGGADDG